MRKRLTFVSVSFRFVVFARAETWRLHERSDNRSEHAGVVAWWHRRNHHATMRALALERTPGSQIDFLASRLFIDAQPTHRQQQAAMSSSSHRSPEKLPPPASQRLTTPAAKINWRSVDAGSLTDVSQGGGTCLQ